MFSRPIVRVLVLAVSTAAAVVAVPALSPNDAHALPSGRWEKLGERSVNGRNDRDSIAVGRDDGLFSTIQLKVEGGPVILKNLKVVFTNNEVFQPQTQLVFGGNTWTRQIDLPGTARAVKRVDFLYSDVRDGKAARVELWGFDRTAGATNAAWNRIGSSSVDGSHDRDVIAVGADDGAFTAVQVRVEGGALVMHDIKIVFANGEVLDPKTRLVFGKDTSTQVIDLPGNRRIIKRVEFRYSDISRDGRARIDLWGKR